METAKLARGDVVVSTAGHDRDGLFFVTGAEEGFAFLADGKLRKLTAPKRKNIKHISFVGRIELSDALQRGDNVLDSQMRRALAVYRVSASQNQRR